MVLPGAKTRYNGACQTGIELRRYASIFLLAIFALALARPSFAEETLTIKAEGWAPYKADSAESKTKALDLGLRNAVTKALETVSSRESLAANSELLDSAIYSVPKEFIIAYRIFSEGILTHTDSLPQMPEDWLVNLERGPAGVQLYHVWIEATIDMTKLKGAASKVTLPGNEVATRITIVILDVKEYSAFEQLRSRLQGMSEIRGRLEPESFHNNRFALSAITTSTPQALAETIRRQLGSGYMVTAYPPKTVVIKKGQGIE